DWYPWGEEAFEKAKKEDKPIFLSIGYSTCHWCHVMAHESFEDEEIGNLMNDIFVSIKVDREERPDIDKTYMTICQMMTRTGGWPLTIIMTPEKKPFFAGTYFPKESRFGRMGFNDLILKIKEIWNNKKDEIFEMGEQIVNQLQEVSSVSPGMSLGEKDLRNAFNNLSMRFDEKNGGFGSAPKFPTPHNLLFLLRFWRRTGKKDALEIVEKTLNEMRKGGIYDHLGYGFHRYSTDANWLVPHFEKMLYDNALLAMAFSEVYAATEKAKYSKTTQEILTYILRDMTSSEGGFYSAEDADSEGVEGKFYVWAQKEINELLDAEEAKIAIEVFNIKKEGNFLEEATQEKTGQNIIHITQSLEKLADQFNLKKMDLKIKLERIRKKLFDYRKERIHPHKDDKILTDWNGLMIAAFAKAGKILCESMYIDTAEKAVNFIFQNMVQSNGRLYHRYRNGDASIDGYLDDYVFLIWGLIELYEATFKEEYLKKALKFNQILLDHFWDDYIGGFYFTPDDAEEILTRQKEIYDGAIPSGNSVAMLNLLRLSYITGDSELEEKADYLSRVFAETVRGNPTANMQLMVAVDFAVGPSYSVVIAGDTGSVDTQSMLNAVRENYLPNKVLMLRKTNQSPPNIDRISNFVQNFSKLNGIATAYICYNKTCKPATNEIPQIIEYLEPDLKKDKK
ncbi:MAG: DUF255 domain-containing protein, partial [Candidatus Lokiarchaeota archaeon]|nr:DUF255 domain-containing protein [Candidatus Lokiarchaeota archaeon]MBD3340278.1 DUF255 domain-containing protein [Candidatus Lokiarchaeota archaeon]